MFKTIIDNEDSGLVKCDNCGHSFYWDVHDEENMVFCEQDRCLYLKCPACGISKVKIDLEKTSNKLS